MRIFYSIVFSIFLLALFCQTELYSQTIAPDLSSGKFPRFFENVIPAPFIYLDKDNSSYIILVEKRGQSLFLLNMKNGNIGIEKTYISHNICFIIHITFRCCFWFKRSNIIISRHIYYSLRKK